jgi:hypothetical protein
VVLGIAFGTLALAILIECAVELFTPASSSVHLVALFGAIAVMRLVLFALKRRAGDRGG